MTAPHSALYWHVTVTVAGDTHSLTEVERGLSRLADEHPFLLAGRYDQARAEVSYWEEARDANEASALALRMWETHRSDAELPDWHVVGLEVHERDAYHHRGDKLHGLAVGDVKLF